MYIYATRGYSSSYFTLFYFSSTRSRSRRFSFTSLVHLCWRVGRRMRFSFAARKAPLVRDTLTLRAYTVCRCGRDHLLRGRLKHIHIYIYTQFSNDPIHINTYIYAYIYIYKCIYIFTLSLLEFSQLVAHSGAISHCASNFIYVHHMYINIITCMYIYIFY